MLYLTKLVDLREQFETFIKNAHERATRGWLNWKLVPEEIRKIIESDTYLERGSRVLVIGTHEDKVKEVASEFENFGRSQGTSNIQVEVVRHAFYIANAFFRIGHTYPSNTQSLPKGVIYLGHIKHYEHTGKPEIGQQVLLNTDLGNGWGNPQTLLEKLCAKYNVPLRKYYRQQFLETMRALLPTATE